jgi:hypothetical protein
MNKLAFLPLLLLTACAGFERSCSSQMATSFGSDWIVLQYGFDGTPINCWKLTNTSIANEEHTDGIYWQDPAGHLAHISGWYNRVQVNGSNFTGAAKVLGIDMAACQNGSYAKPAKIPNLTVPDQIISP